MLFAAQTKLNGHAKTRNESSPAVFQTFEQFSAALMKQFPVSVDEADVHIKMMQSNRKFSETFDDYFYRMCALGRRGKLRESTIIKYIRKGLKQNYVYPGQSTSRVSYVQQGATAAVASTSDVGPLKQETAVKSEVSKNVPSEPIGGSNNVAADRGHRGLICFNCKERGHTSNNCTQPRRPRCEKCRRRGHRTEDCLDVVPTEGVMNIGPDSSAITKSVLVNNVTFTVFVDPGSYRSLVKQSVASTIQDFVKMDPPQRLKGFGGGEYLFNSKITPIVKIDDEIFNAELYVVADSFLSYPILVGRDLLGREGQRFVFQNGECHVEGKRQVISEDLETGDRNKLEQMCEKYGGCFGEKLNELGKCKNAAIKIQLKSDKPVCRRPYRVPFAKRENITKMIKELLENGIIRRSESSFASPIVIVKKQNGEDRLCVDYRELNSITIKQPFPMPIIEELLASLAGYTYFTTLDFMSGYYKNPVDPESQPYTAFVANDGHFEFLTMPFGLVNAPSVFQSVMNKMITDLQKGDMIAYLDDVIIPSYTVEQGLQKLERVLKMVQSLGLTLRYSKCVFLAKKI